MTRSSKPGSAYPDDWGYIAKAVKDAAGWRCIRCDHEHDPKGGYTLTVHHFDLDPSNNRWWNLGALCQRCHLSVQARVNLDRPWVMDDHSAWFKPYVAGFYAAKYLGIPDVPRSVIDYYLDFFLAVERRIVVEGLSREAVMALLVFIDRYRRALDQIAVGEIVVPPSGVRPE